MNPSTPSRGQGTGLYVELNPEELPPSYYDHEGNTLSSSFQNDARAASATMRLLPTGYDSEDMGGGSDLGTNATHFRMGQTSSTRRSAIPSPTRATPNRVPVFRPRQNSVASNIGHTPSIPPPAALGVDSPQYSYGPGSPMRPWTPSRASTRREANSSISGVSYEPADLNGSPRPGTPSSAYGGSPRRPLPPAPLFLGPSASSRETSIDIGDKCSAEDPFGGDGQIIDARRSYDSFRSESTMVTDEKEVVVKVDLDEATHDGEADDTEMLVDPNIHYGPAPEGIQSRRGVRSVQASKKEVQLINGELVLECKIPTTLHSFLPRRDDREFTHMRYTAVTCDPDEFKERGYKLRQNIGSTMRETELFICVTMYNENEVLFTRTID